MTPSASVPASDSISPVSRSAPRDHTTETPGACGELTEGTESQEQKAPKSTASNAADGGSAIFRPEEARQDGAEAAGHEATREPEVVGTIGPVLPLEGLMPAQLHAAVYLASGLSASEAARRCGLGRTTVAKWLQNPRFMRAVREATQTHVGRIQSLLLEGEVRASQTLITALDAMMPAKSGSKVTMVPDWPSRIKAADSLLDRRSERGKPVERVQSENVHWTPGEMRSELASALHDPAVQKLLHEDPDLKRRLVLELAQMQTAAGTESLPALASGAADDETSGSAGDRAADNLGG